MKISNLVTQKKNINPSESQTTLSVSENYGIVPQDFLFKKKIALKDRSKYLIVEYGDVVYNPFLLWNGAAGTCFFKDGGCTSPAYKVLKPNFPNIEYVLHYLFRSDIFKNSVDLISTGTVVRRRTAPIEKVLDMNLNIKKLEELEKSNNFFKSVEKKIYNLQRKIEILQNYINETFENNFFKETSDSKEVQSQKKVLGDYINIHKESINPQKHLKQNFYHYSIPAFDDKGEPTLEIGSSIKSTKFKLKKNVILFSKLNPGNPRVWFPDHDDNFEGICSTEFLVVSPNSNSNIEFLWGLFTSKKLQSQFKSMVTGTSKSHQRIKSKDLETIKIKMPIEDSSISKFSNKTKIILERILLCKKEISKLKELRNILKTNLIFDK